MNHMLTYQLSPDVSVAIEEYESTSSYAQFDVVVFFQKKPVGKCLLASAPWHCDTLALANDLKDSKRISSLLQEKEIVTTLPSQGTLEEIAAQFNLLNVYTFEVSEDVENPFVWGRTQTPGDTPLEILVDLNVLGQPRVWINLNGSHIHIQHIDCWRGFHGMINDLLAKTKQKFEDSFGTKIA